VVVVNKSDLAGARTASSEVEQRLSMNGRGQRLLTTQAKRHRDAGVDELFGLLVGTDHRLDAESGGELLVGNKHRERRGRREHREE